MAFLVRAHNTQCYEQDATAGESVAAAKAARSDKINWEEGEADRRIAAFRCRRSDGHREIAAVASEHIK